MTTDILIQVEEIISTEPQYTLKEIIGILEKSNNVTLSLTTVNNALQKLMVTVKKPHRELQRVNEQSYIEKRKLYAIWFNEMFKRGYGNTYFVDESPFTLHLSRQIARSRRGQKANVIVPTIRSRNVSLIASIGIDGMKFCKVIENSTVNGDIFAVYIRDLCCYLKNVTGVSNACIILEVLEYTEKLILKQLRQNIIFNLCSFPRTHTC